MLSLLSAACAWLAVTRRKAEHGRVFLFPCCVKSCWVMTVILELIYVFFLRIIFIFFFGNQLFLWSPSMQEEATDFEMSGKFCSSLMRQQTTSHFSNTDDYKAYSYWTLDLESMVLMSLCKVFQPSPRPGRCAGQCTDLVFSSRRNGTFQLRHTVMSLWSASVCP